MCGICGFIHADRTKQASEAILRGMMDSIRHRGPDDQGTYIKDNVALGHRRLSIIDLKTGHQPMQSDDGQVTIVYNGEVYNFNDIKKSLARKGHKFRTHSDTEVVLHAYQEYGEDCLKYFNGMFALAIWDGRRKKLFLARDRFGKKPLYYALFDNQFIFGSELKAVLKHPSVRKEIDPAALNRYLAYEYVPSPYTIFKNIRKLEAGYRMTVENAAIAEIAPYWDMPSGEALDMSVEEIKERLRILFRESVKRRLISDVPLGVFLSGGIDSSAVVAMMAELMPPKEIKTFSIGFGEKSFDESDDALRVARHFRTDHHCETLSPSTMLGIFPKILDVLDEPFADSSIIPTYLVSNFTRRSVTVALGGDGGDELFCGYPSFLAHKIDDLLGFIPDKAKRLPFELLVKLIPPSGDYMSLNFKARRFARGLKFPKSMRHQVWIGSFTPEEQKKLLTPDYLKSDIYDRTEGFYSSKLKADPLSRAMYVYIKTYMTDDILTKVDRASMANSLEVRAPFLDTEFSEFASSIPSSKKLKGYATKWILKEAFKDKLPKETLGKRKQGFAVPVAKWLKDDLRPLFDEAFNEKKVKEQGIFNYASLKGILDEFTRNKSDTRKEIWALFMFEMWYDRWMK